MEVRRERDSKNGPPTGGRSAGGRRGRSVIELQGDVRANHGEITERAAERRRLSGGRRPAGAKHRSHGVPSEPNDLLDKDELALNFIVQRLVGFDMLPRQLAFRGGR